MSDTNRSTSQTQNASPDGNYNTIEGSSFCNIPINFCGNGIVSPLLVPPLLVLEDGVEAGDCVAVKGVETPAKLLVKDWGELPNELIWVIYLVAIPAIFSEESDVESSVVAVVVVLAGETLIRPPAMPALPPK